ncbi:MAG: hypothetical protein HUK40_23190 [Desulfobacter sp.]|nr:hypothetical protein [Desulfobacter sp.]WDP86081.1 MAG: hypothetical protein HUN05_13895 [Desulfobacter sp.]
MIHFFSHYLNKKNDYYFNNSWDIHAPLEQSWNELINYKQWPQWCHALETIDSIGQTAHLKKGNHIRSVWKGTLPYTICFDATIKDVKPYSFLSFTVTGDLNGEGSCHFLESNENTRINFIWNIFPTKLWMRMTAPFARPLFIENHDLVIEQAVQGFVGMMEEKQGPLPPG